MVHNLSRQNSIVHQWMHELRSADAQKDRIRFRKNLHRLGEIAAYEISREMEYIAHQTTTSLGEAATHTLKEFPVLVTVLRAGIPLQQGLLHYFDQAECGFIATYRRHHRDGSFEIAENYLTCPRLDGRTVIIADTMIATGATLLLSLNSLKEKGDMKKIHVVSVIACNQGIEKIQRKFPDISIWTGDIDDELTAKGFIVPGLGDAGDLAYGSKGADAP